MHGYKWKRARLSLKHKRNKDEFELKQGQIEDLKSLEDSGFIDLFYGDESHFGLTPNVPYAWQLKDEPLLLPAAKGKFLNVVGLMSRKNVLFSQVLETTFNTDKIIDFMDSFVEQIKKITVVILDNSPIHKSKKFIAKIQEWKEKDLLIFFLPPYSPELNLIEILWRRIKYNWIPLDAYLSFQNLKDRLSFVLNNFGTKYDIIF
jgi:transposase